MKKSVPYVPFSQRTGLSPIPPQLKLGEVSPELRRLLSYYLGLELARGTLGSYGASYFSLNLKRVATDLHVIFFGQPAHTFPNDVHHTTDSLNSLIERGNIGQLFDLVEFLVLHPKCSNEMKEEFAKAFVTSRAAYRIIDRQITAIGTDEQAIAFQQAIADAETTKALAARNQLIAAGVALRNGDWAGSIRESIHSVEAVAVSLAPGTDTLGAALKVLEQSGNLHGSLKAAFSSLYGYASDEEGVRHALVFKDETKVDETDALFMLGACASFVSYLLARAK